MTEKAAFSGVERAVEDGMRPSASPGVAPFPGLSIFYDGARLAAL